jgi:thymidine phosphorylase
MDQPLGRAVGNACELAEAIEILRGGGPPDTRALTLRLGAEMLILGKRATTRAQGLRLLEEAVASGAGLQKLRDCVQAQGGDVAVIDAPERLPRAARAHTLRAAAGGVIRGIDAGAVGRAMTLLGAGRLRQEDRVDPGVGLELAAKVGERVEPGGPLGTVRFNDRERWRLAQPLLESAFEIAEVGGGGGAGAGLDTPPGPLVLETIGKRA